MAFNLWEPDTLLPSQYAALRQSRQCPPEQRLLFAVLTSALADFQEAVRSPGAPQNSRLREVHEWFFTPDPAWPFSFENLCTQLDLDPDYIRSGLAGLANK
jgi:hypothetical protein